MKGACATVSWRSDVFSPTMTKTWLALGTPSTAKAEAAGFAAACSAAIVLTEGLPAPATPVKAAIVPTAVTAAIANAATVGRRPDRFGETALDEGENTWTSSKRCRGPGEHRMASWEIAEDAAAGRSRHY
jgi:hypothetical protein